MGFRCGIVGLPNVGKSTLFNALTAAEVQAANYPFCTIDPNLGAVPVPDDRLQALADIVKPERIIATSMEFVDIAGLVAGAAEGEGLGNQFLGHIRETDAIAHVVRCFDDEDMVHVAGRVAPADDVETINTELALADLEACQRALVRAEKGLKGGADAASKAWVGLLQRVSAHLDGGQPVRTLPLSEQEQESLHAVHLLTIKPVMYIANVDENGLRGGGYVDELQALAAAEGAQVVAVCAALEADIAQLSGDEQAEFLADLQLQQPGLERVVQAGYTLLGLQTFFTAGKKEVRAWTVPVGATAPQAAGRIHTDFERGFIRAEVIAYQDYLTYCGEQGARDAGKLRSEGRDYRVKEGDVIHFRFNV